MRDLTEPPLALHDTRVLVVDREPLVEPGRQCERRGKRIEGRVDELLEASELPALPSHLPLSNVVVALVDRKIVGAIALANKWLNGASNA